MKDIEKGIAYAKASLAVEGIPREIERMLPLLIT